MRPRKEQPIITLILRELETGPSTAYELAHIVGIHVRNVREYLKLLHAERKIRIAAFESLRTGPDVPIWALNQTFAADARGPRKRKRRHETVVPPKTQPRATAA